MLSNNIPSGESAAAAGLVTVRRSNELASENSFAKVISAIPSPPNIIPSNSCVANSSTIAAPSVA